MQPASGREWGAPTSAEEARLHSIAVLAVLTIGQTTETVNPTRVALLVAGKEAIHHHTPNGQSRIFALTRKKPIAGEMCPGCHEEGSLSECHAGATDSVQ